MSDANLYKSDLVDLKCSLLHETPGAKGAWKVRTDAGRVAWAPKSQCELYRDPEGSTLTIPRWIAREKKLI